MIYRKVKVGENAAIAAIHKEAFGDFFLSSLGIGFLNTYYKACLKEPTSIAVCAVDEAGVLKGFATGSLHAGGYHRKLFLNNLFSFLLSITGFLFTKPKAIVRLAKNLNKTPDVNDKQDYSELLSIAVVPELKGAGVARELLKLFEEEVIRMGGNRIALTTDFENNERVIAFYQKCNYKIFYDFITYPDRHMYKMIKHLNQKDEKGF